MLTDLRSIGHIPLGTGVFEIVQKLVFLKESFISCDMNRLNASSTLNPIV